MTKKTICIFLLGLVCGLTLMGAFAWHAQQLSAEAAPLSLVSTAQKSAPNIALALPLADSSQVSSTAPVWSPESVYTGGDTIAYNGKLYRAKWWTQGETPGQSDVWEDTFIAAGHQRSTPTATSAADPTVGKREDFKVVGYYPAWKEDLSKLRYDVLTHVNYAFAIPTAEGGLRPLDNAAQAQQIIRDAHASGCKVLLAVGGWSYNDTPLEATFVAATETAEKRTAFAEAIMTMCTQYGFDGIDMDWEHPRTDSPSAQAYEALMLDLAGQLHAQGKLLSAAVLSGATADGNIYYDAAAHSDAVLQAVDYINVMAYDGGDGQRHSSYDFAVNCAAYWRETRQHPADKVVLGVPFYARPSWAAYSDLLAADKDAWQHDHITFNGMDVWYNGWATITQKTRYAMNHLGGIMIWELTQDGTGEHSLLTAIGQSVAQTP